MRNSVLVALGLALFTGSAQMPAMQACPYGPNSSAHEHGNIRIRHLVTEVLHTAGMNPLQFALCEDLYLRSPFIRRYERRQLKIFALLMPQNAARHTDDEIRGQVAHELGHVDTYGVPLSIAAEIDADKKAVQWVGAQTVAAGITALLSTYDHFSEELRAPIVRQYQARMSRLEYRTSSR